MLNETQNNNNMETQTHSLTTSLRDARQAMEHLRDLNLNFTNDGSDCFVFETEEELEDALQELEFFQLEVLESTQL